MRGGLSRRALVAAVVATFGLLSAVVAPVSAVAGGDRSLNRWVDGPFTGIATYRFSVTCAGVYSEHFYEGVGQGRNRSGTAHLVLCVDPRTSPSTVTGTFVLTSGSGAALGGTVAGVTTRNSFSHTYTVTSGTRRFRGASGTINATGAYIQEFGQGVTDLEGTYVGALIR